LRPFDLLLRPGAVLVRDEGKPSGDFQLLKNRASHELRRPRDGRHQSHREKSTAVSSTERIGVPPEEQHWIEFGENVPSRELAVGHKERLICDQPTLKLVTSRRV